MKKKLLISMLLLFVGVSMQAQSVATEQMDKRFNDGTNLPYGWFTEGWAVKDGVIQTEASSGSSFNIGEMMGGGGNSKPNEDPEGGDPEETESEGEEPGGEPGDDPNEDPDDEPGGTQFDISSLLESFMGGNSKPNYLLTPHLVVQEGEALVFSAKKGKNDNSGSGMSISLGAADSTFVVERSVYSKNQWVRIADLTLELDTVFKTFTITDTPAGEYRFRFRSGGAVQIDSIAGFHIDNEAPDIYIIENDARAWHLDFSLCAKDSTRTLKVINTTTGTLNVNITPEDAALFSVSEGSLAVAAADTLDVNITFNYAAGKAGKNETGIAFTPADERVLGKTLRATAVITQLGVWMEDFNNNVQPKGFFTEGWVFRDSVATTSSSGGMAAMFGGGGTTDFLMTPPLTVESTDEVLLFSAKSGSSDDGMAGMGAMFGGGSSSVIVEKSVYGSNKWEKVKEFTEPLDTAYRVLWVGYIEPGEYRFRILASDSIVVDSIAGFHLDNNAPDIYVLHNNTAAGAINYGMPQTNSTESFAVVNTGTGTLQVGVATTDETVFALSSKDLAIEASDTAFVDVTYVFDEQSLGIHRGAVTFTPTTTVLVPISSGLTAYSTYTDAWTEDFEPEFLREDDTKPIDFPEGWETTGWEVKLPSSGGGIMDMFSGIMGGGNEAPKTWMATTESEAYELITPRLQAQKGDVLRFEAELGDGGGMMAMMSMFMGGGEGASGQLNVYYTLDDGENWTYYDTFIQNGYAYFVAPYSGIYRLRFTSPSASLDNFYGFHKPLNEIALYDEDDVVNSAVLEEYNGQTVNVHYDRVLSATQQSDGTWNPRAYIVSLPYDYNLTDYNEADQAKIFRLRFKEEYYKQFIFLPDDSDTPNLMQAGRAYLVIVLKGQLNLSATGVTLNNTIVDDEQNVVNSFEDWYFEDKFTPVGKWKANFRSISDVEADTLNIYGLRNDGTWARFQSDGGVEKSSLTAFRGYYELDASGEAPADTRMSAPAKPGTYRTMFQISDQQGTGTGENVSFDNLDYEDNIPFIDGHSTGIEPCLRAIDTDGTSRYFDLQGRLLYSRPDKGVYI